MHNDWFVCHSDKVEIEGSTPSVPTKDTYSNVTHILFLVESQRYLDYAAVA